MKTGQLARLSYFMGSVVSAPALVLLFGCGAVIVGVFLTLVMTLVLAGLVVYGASLVIAAALFSDSVEETLTRRMEKFATLDP